ncbi:MAG: discoidin domain-containing protein, partial [Planctomycetes bacterium]|nr:discoidin domain-containing protein [Planctomycetota bacterium]
YPCMSKAVPGGLELSWPHTWEVAKDGKTAKMVANGRFLIGAKKFNPECAEADAWSDWLVRIRMPDSSGKAFLITIAHGVPYTYVEADGLDPWIELGDAKLFGASKGKPSDRIGIQLGDDFFGVYVPAGTLFDRDGSKLVFNFPAGRRYFSIAPLPKQEDLDAFAAQASVVPRKTTVRWNYEPEKGRIETLWTVESEDLSGKGGKDILQGWLPHHYSAPSKVNFPLDGPRYDTVRGEMRCAVGHEFSVTIPFTGLLPEYPSPEIVQPDSRYRPELMRNLVESYRTQTGYGSETYWGGKLVRLYARYMEEARQLGMKEETNIFRDRAAEAVRDWLTYDPGEGEHFFAWYNNWGSFVGCRSRDNANPGVDILQDHHMCYGYHIYAAALLSFQDPEFAKAWGPMARLVAMDYANWDENSKLFCRLRNLDPWCGHSWSGGMGSAEGNGQESSSEAMQGYGAMFLLGEALGDKELRDAGAFCWATEARGIAEYYFDRSKRNFPREWPHTMVSNLHTNGLGFWTWFSGNPYWMHAIQWLPMSPLLSYLSEDRNYAAADFAQMWKTHEGGKGWNDYLGNNSGVCNVTLNYLACSDPDKAAEVFDMLTDQNRGGVKGAEAAGCYWHIHSIEALGQHRFDAWTDVPTSQAFGDDDAKIAWAVYNAGDAVREVTCYIKGKEVARFSAPPRRVSVMREGKVYVDKSRMEPVPPLVSKVEETSLSDFCKATASSQQGGDTGVDKAFDTDPGTRWSSRSTDSEWISVDLGSQCSLKRAVLVWETAFGKDYDIEGSDDGNTWRKLGEMRNGDGGTDEINLEGKARFVRMKGIKRGTNWGWSLFSFDIYGESTSAAAGKLVIEPSVALMNELETAKFKAYVVEAKGGRKAVAAKWAVRGRGKISDDGIFTPTGGGVFNQPKFMITAEADGLRAQAYAVVEEARRVGKLELSPGSTGAALKLGVGDSRLVNATALDQFSAYIDQNPEIKVTGPLELRDGMLVATAIGKGSLVAELAGKWKVHPVEVVPAWEVNIAAGSASRSSSTEGNLEADNAFDGNPKTRWASQSSDPQWLRVDLGKVREIGRVVLVWENAHAKHYRIEVSDDGAHWKPVHEETDCKGKTERLTMAAGVKGRYVRMYGLTRTTGYGYSLFEFEVYPPR